MIDGVSTIAPRSVDADSSRIDGDKTKELDTAGG